MTVTPIEGEIFRFYVSSESEPGKVYLVDLQENDFSGKCGCPHFTCRLQVLFDGGTRGKAVACKHIIAAKESWFDTAARQIAKLLGL